MNFEWDENKNTLNKKKHHVSFEMASHIFEDPHLIEMYDLEHSLDEDRYIAIGKFKNILFVVCRIYGKKGCYPFNLSQASYCSGKEPLL